MDEVATGMHWLTFTTSLKVDDVMERIGGGFGDVEQAGAFNQPRSVSHESGARIYFGSKDPRQPVTVNVPGEVCEGWADEALGWACVSEARTTRIDVALDLSPVEQARKRMIEMRRAWKSGRVDTRIRTFSEHRSDPPEGWTWYFGGRDSALKLRAYDKRGPLRLEWQWRPDGELREHVAPLVRKRGAASLWRGLSEAIVFPMSWYQELLRGDTLEWSPATVRENEFLKVVEHLRDQFGPTMWALQQLGMTLDDLTVEPEAPDGRAVAKWLRWADQAETEGYDGERLRREARCRLRRIRT